MAPCTSRTPMTSGSRSRRRTRRLRWPPAARSAETRASPPRPAAARLHHRPHLAGQADLAKADRPLVHRPPGRAGGQRHRHRQIRRRLVQPHAARHVHEHVLLSRSIPARRSITASSSDTRFGSMPSAVRRGTPPRAPPAPAPRQDAAASPRRRRHRRARHAQRPLGEEQRRRVGHLAQALAAHLEHAHLVRRAEAVLAARAGCGRVPALALEQSTTSTTCSSVLGPASAPSLVT